MSLYDEVMADEKIKSKLERVLKNDPVPRIETSEQIIQISADYVENCITECFSQDMKVSSDSQSISILEDFLFKYTHLANDDAHFLVAGEKVIARCSELDRDDEIVLPTRKNADLVINGMKNYYLNLFAASFLSFTRRGECLDVLNLVQFTSQLNNHLTNVIAYDIADANGFTSIPMITPMDGTGKPLGSFGIVLPEEEIMRELVKFAGRENRFAERTLQGFSEKHIGALLRELEKVPPEHISTIPKFARKRKFTPSDCNLDLTREGDHYYLS